MQNRLIDAREEKPLQKADKGKGHPRILRANRQQIEMRMAALDSLVPEDHKVRIIWEMAQEYDLSKLYGYIDAIEEEAGRRAIDPLILVVLWLYATTEGVGSARELAGDARNTLLISGYWEEYLSTITHWQISE